MERSKLNKKYWMFRCSLKNRDVFTKKWITNASIVNHQKEIDHIWTFNILPILLRI